MKRVILPSQVSGIVQAPPSKSITQRAIAAALLSEGETTIINPSYCDDTLAAMSIATGLGAKVRPITKELKISGSIGLKENKLNCGESGLAIRMFSPIAALFPEKITLTGTGTLKSRPMSMIEEALVQFGVRCETKHGSVPITIHGPLKGGKCVIDGSISSQIITGLLMALPVVPEDSEIEVSQTKSKPYIDMTIKTIKHFGIHIEKISYNLFKIPGNQKYQSKTIEVEGDWSGASFLLVAGAIGGSLTVKGLSTTSQQSDKAILIALDKAGAQMVIGKDQIEVTKGNLKSFEFDATDSPDLFPPLVALAAYCKGTSAIKGVTRLVSKESNRCQALVEVFSKLGVKTEVIDDFMLVTGGNVSGGNVVSHDDHRIAMALAVAAIGASKEVSLKDSHCVSKSYPVFFEDLRHVGVIVNER